RVAAAGNFSIREAAEFLSGFADVLQPTDSFIIGVDSCSDPNKIYHAYNGARGRFILNGLTHANEILGAEEFNTEDWRAVGEYVYDEDGGRHRAFVSPVRETVALGASVKPQERVQIEQSLKYSPTGYTKLFRWAGLAERRCWSLGGEYGLHWLQKSEMASSPIPSIYAAKPLPTLHDWEVIWRTWDMISQKMLPAEELQGKPIKLRNACIFYLGHIPAFLDIQLDKSTGQSLSGSAYFHSIFERGIDPDVDDPERCHDHSEVPDEWPAAGEILDYQGRVRDRLRGLYANGQDMIPRDVGRTIWLGYEHEAMHIETFLYMLLQSDKTLPPPHTERPDFEKLAREAYEARVPNQWFGVPEQTIPVGMDDPEDDTDPNRHFAWDIEKPAREQKVRAFQAQGRPITNEDYAKYLYHSKIDQIPAAWVKTDTHSNGVANGDANGNTNGNANGNANGSANGNDALPASFLRGKAVRTVYGPVPLEYALDWPVSASYDELAGCASWMGGRIPTAEEARSIYHYVFQQNKLTALNTLAKKVPAVNGHLVNDGVEETPPQAAPHAEVDGGSSDLHIDLSGANVGFKHWHPTAVTARGGALAGQGDMGGLWEWTSTPLAAHDGYAPMPLYPGYSADFFDGKHNVVLGGSWATLPRLAGRRSFVNWYQRNYPYMWAGARLVRDDQ
ncbi:hypothetical protein S40285_07854, partial [Stachybotrys chlorohalonatus IBT 40285]